MPSLLEHSFDDEARCVHCGRPAAGPCASCREPVCGDCCTLTEGGTKVFAICLDCDRRGGRSLTPAWRGVVGLLALVLGGLLAVVALLSVFASR